MGNEYKIELSAVDHTTAIVKKINASTEKMLRPITNFQKSLAALKNEVGLNVVAKGMKEVGRVSKDIAEKIASITAPMAALVGVGTLGGIAALSTEWGKLGFQITNSASMIGISTTQLQGIRGAASMAGVAAGELDGGLRSISDTLEGAQFGRNQPALMLMQRFGISLHRLKDGSVDSVRGLLDISKAMAGMSAEKQRLIANTMGAGSLLPMLQKGPAVIAAFQARYEKLAGVMSGPATKAAADYEMKIILMQAAIEGLKNKIGEKLIPIMSPLIDKFTNWVYINKEAIALKLSEWIEKVVGWAKKFYKEFKAGQYDEYIQDLKDIGAGFVSIGKGIAYTIQQMGKLSKMPVPGFLATATALPKMLFGNGGKREASGDITYPDGDAGATGAPTAKSADLFSGLEKQYSLPGGILDNLWVKESGRGTNMLGPMTKYGQAKGHFQFTDATAKEYGLSNPNDLVSSSVAASHKMANLMKEFNGSIEKSVAAYNWGDGNLKKELAKYGDNWKSHLPRETSDFVNKVVSPSMLAQEDQAPDSNDAMPTMSMARTAPPQAMDVSRLLRVNSNSAEQTSGATSSGGTEHKITVDVNLGNAPAGTTASAKTGNGAPVPTRIQFAMPIGVMP